MMIYILIATCIIIAALAVILSARTRLSVSFQNAVFNISVSVLGCGLKLTGEDRKFSVFCGRWIYSFKKSSKTSQEKRKKEVALSQEDKKLKKKSRPRLPLSTLVKIARAGIIFVARFIASVQYNEGQLDLQPVIANPALAGMAFGWGKAINGVFPGMQRVFNLAPSGGTGASRVSGHLVLSIKNGRVAALVWRLLRDLPIKELIKYKFSKKR